MSIENLLIEFDEMGYCPTTLCENPNEQAIKWKNDLIVEIEKLNQKIAELEDMIEQGKFVEKIEPETEMTKEQQIQEMELLILETERHYKKTLCLNTVGKSRIDSICDSLYNAGYRKQEEIEKQVAKTKTKTNLEFLKNMCPFGFMQIIFDKITEFERNHYPEFDFEISYRTEEDFEEWLNKEHKE